MATQQFYCIVHERVTVACGVLDGYTGREHTFEGHSILTNELFVAIGLLTFMVNEQMYNLRDIRRAHPGPRSDTCFSGHSGSGAPLLKYHSNRFPLKQRKVLK